MASAAALAKEPAITPLGVISPPPISVECEAFSGSLAALFNTVKQGRIDLLGIPLAPVCEAYFLYLVESAPMDLDSAAAALIALAYLLERKAWALIPTEQDEPEVDLPGELPTMCPGDFQAAIEALNLWHEERGKHYFRGASSSDSYELPFELGAVSSIDLARALERVLARAKPDDFVDVSAARRSLSDQMVTVMGALTSEWTRLECLLPNEFTRSDVVWTFLALLELIRLGQARVRLLNDDVEFARGEKH